MDRYEPGALHVLNTGFGDIKVTFNEHDSAERRKALKMLADMRERGYAILVRLPDDTYVRAETVDAVRGCYIVSVPDWETQDQVEGQFRDDRPATPLLPPPGPPAQPSGEQARPADAPRRRGRKPKAEIPIERAQAFGVGRSAGG